MRERGLVEIPSRHEFRNYVDSGAVKVQYRADINALTFTVDHTGSGNSLNDVAVDELIIYLQYYKMVKQEKGIWNGLAETGEAVDSASPTGTAQKSGDEGTGNSDSSTVGLGENSCRCIICRGTWLEANFHSSPEEYAAWVGTGDQETVNGLPKH